MPAQIVSSKSQNGSCAGNRQSAISAADLVRRFGTFTAVNDVSFAVKQGEIFGFPRPQRQRKNHRHQNADRTCCRSAVAKPASKA